MDSCQTELAMRKCASDADCAYVVHFSRRPNMVDFALQLYDIAQNQSGGAARHRSLMMSAKKNEGEAEPEVKEAFDAWLEAQGGKEQLVSRMRTEKVANLIKGATWETKIGELLGKAEQQDLLVRLERSHADSAERDSEP